VTSTLKIVDTGLKASYIFGGVAVAGIIFTELSGFMRSGRNNN